MRIIKFFAVILIAGLVGYYIGVTKISLDWKSFQPRIEVEGKEPPASLSHIDFSKFWAVMERVNENYYDKKAIDSQKMLDGAIAGMVDSLDDPYTVYLPPVQNTD
ncbi:MAG: carboxyl-terminal processing protease, partial [Patescibacteria group bacterium]|nr:carboxyl-terminal processing protease [Patescibacteria group bacterium]